MQAQLTTYTGEFVADVSILPFVDFPELLLWGERSFIFTGTYTGKDLPIYREARGVTAALPEA